MRTKRAMRNKMKMRVASKMTCKCGEFLEAISDKILKCTSCELLVETLDTIDIPELSCDKQVYIDQYDNLYTTYVVDSSHMKGLVRIDTNNEILEGYENIDWEYERQCDGGLISPYKYDELVEFTDEEIKLIQKYINNTLFCAWCNRRYWLSELELIDIGREYAMVGLDGDMCEVDYEVAHLHCKKCKNYIETNNYSKVIYYETQQIESRLEAEDKPESGLENKDKFRLPIIYKLLQIRKSNKSNKSNKMLGKSHKYMLNTPVCKKCGQLFCDCKLRCKKCGQLFCECKLKVKNKSKIFK